MAKDIHIGSISHGTLKSSDLVEAFYTELSHKEKKAFDATDSGKIVTGLRLLNDTDVWDAFDATEDASEIVRELDEILGTDLPDFLYFGAHPGDGSDFGYWFDNGAFEYAANSGELLKLEAGTSYNFRKTPADVHHVAFISDHGNVELYTRTGKHLYGVV